MTSSGFSESAITRLSEVLQSHVDKGRLPGAVAYVAQHGQPVLHRAWGWQGPAAGTPMARDSIFRIY